MNIGHTEIVNLCRSAGKIHVRYQPPGCFRSGNPGGDAAPGVGREIAVAMRKRQVRRVAGILQMLEIVAWPEQIRKGIQNTFDFKVGITWERRRFAFAKVGKDQSEVFLCWAASDADLLRERLLLGRLFDALARAVVFPAVIHASEAIAFDPSGRELRSAMSAAKVDYMRALFSAVECEVFTHDPDRFGMSGCQILRAAHGLPKKSQVTTR